MGLTGFWEDATHYRVVETETGRAETVTVLGTAQEMRDAVWLSEYEHYARESVLRDWKKQDAAHNRPYTERERKDLGGTLLQIKKSRKYRRENGYHDRYWLGKN